MSRRGSRLGVAFILLLTMATMAWARRPGAVANAAQTQLDVDRLSVLGSALYIAAHPDDENTAFLAWLARERHIRTAYVSLTRGGGGQNLIGTEQGAALGLLRTQELLAARAVDGAEQYFSRAVDFGYSKSTDEALSKWGENAVLRDLVWVIRAHRPDILVTRFSETVGGHGHHTASATLALQAFHAAGDPTRFADQLQQIEAWQPKRLLWNNWRPQLEGRDEDLPQLVSVDVGAYNELVGESYTEIAARSRSMHKCQGFGRAGSRGTSFEYFELTAGEPIVDDDLFDGIDTSFGRLAGSAEVAKWVTRAQAESDPRVPAAVVPALLRAHDALHALPPGYWRDRKIDEVRGVVKSALGLWTEAIAAAHSVAPGGVVAVTTTVVNRSSTPLSLRAVDVTYAAPSLAMAEALELAENGPVEYELSVSIPPETAPSEPYWLTERPGDDRVNDPRPWGQAESAPALSATIRIDAGPESQHDLVYVEPVLYRWTDPVRGELYRDVGVVPPVSVELDDAVYLFADSTPKTVEVVVRASVAQQKGTITLDLPREFSMVPSAASFELEGAGDEARCAFRVTPGDAAGRFSVRANAVLDDATYSRRVARIDHPHIPLQTYLPHAEAALVRVDLGEERPSVGYLMGAGDKVPQALRQAGYDVTLIDDALLDAGELSRFDAIVTGVRAYNTRPRLAQQHSRLLEYVHSGGTLVVQYNVSRGLVVEPIGPYSMKLSSDRVTFEEAPVRLVSAVHALLRRPNRIIASDFEGWVQERGLYFAREWDERYTTVLASADPGEAESEGSLLVARHGDGVFIYTGLSFFRQLPAGVPGAYRLFANLLAAE